MRSRLVVVAARGATAGAFVMATVFVAGHGRMVMGEPTQTVPPRVTIRWAVPERYASRPQVSRNMIAGRNAYVAEAKAAGERYNEHWLVPDGAENMVMKAKDLVTALTEPRTQPRPAESCWLLQPRDKNAVTLSGIVAYLLTREGIPAEEPIEILWTCCRSPIGELGRWTTEMHRPWTELILKERAGSISTLEPILDPESTDPLRRTETDWKANRFITAEGVVSLVRASDTSAMTNWASWPGINGTYDGRMEFVVNQKLPE
jgi:hypothetical protein